MVEETEKSFFSAFYFHAFARLRWNVFRMKLDEIYLELEGIFSEWMMDEAVQ